MEPASSAELGERLSVLFAALPSSSAGEDSELKLQGYLMALSQFSREVVSEAVLTVLDGTARVNPRFAPTPPELAILCREIKERRLQDVARLRREQAQLEGRQPTFERTPEEQARVNAKVDMVIARLNQTAGDDPLRKDMAEAVSKQLRAIADRARERQRA